MSSNDLAACLPPELQTPTTTITRIAAGLSGAGVYRVEAAGNAFVLKVASPDTPLEDWRRKAHVQQLAASAHLAPRVVHVDETRRAITSEFVVDRGFLATYFDPRTQSAAIAQFGETLARIHALPLPADMPSQDPRVMLETLRASIAAHVPAFVGEAIARMLGEAPPPTDRAPVLSHNDVNPSNLIYDGTHLMLLDWDTAARNDPLYDLATVALFLRMSDDACRALIAAHDAAPPAEPPPRFRYYRRFVAVLCGSAFLHLARLTGYTGPETADTLESFYQRLRSGALSIANADGKWQFGLALVHASLEAR